LQYSLQAANPETFGYTLVYVCLCVCVALMGAGNFSLHIRNGREVISLLLSDIWSTALRHLKSSVAR